MRPFAAFEATKELPKICIYDNMKMAVLERYASANCFHLTLLGMLEHKTAFSLTVRIFYKNICFLSDILIILLVRYPLSKRFFFN
jgi:hypothetical protein